MQQIDYNKFITRKHLDMGAYHGKFDFVRNVLEKKDPTTLDYKRIFQDPTMFCYMMFQVDGKPLKLYPYQDLIVNDPYRWKYFRAANQIGKAEYIENIIPTPKGFKTIGSLKIGDLVFQQNGELTKIVDIPFEGVRPCYRITFDDMSSIVVAKEHLWIGKSERERFRKEYKHNRGKKKGEKYTNPKYNEWRVFSTEEIIKKGDYNPGTIPRKKISIPICSPVEYPMRRYSLSPYCLGLLLGDGCLTSVKSSSFCSGDKEIIEIISNELGVKYYQKSTNCHLINICREYIKILQSMDLIGTYSNTKFIPLKYLEGSINQRIELLRGLMHTDGSVYGKYSTLEYCTVSERLKDDFIELINSLGGVINKVTEKNPFYYAKNREKIYCKKAYAIRFKIDINPFSLKRKADKFKIVTKYRKERLIERIEYEGELETKCISVDSKDNSYLSSFNYIVTHNSLTLDATVARNLLIDHGHAHHEAIVSKSLPQSIFQMRRVKSLLNTARYIEWKEERGDADSMSVISVDVKDTKGNIKYTNLGICAPCTEGLLGYDIHKLNLDEYEFWEVDIKHFFNQIAQPRTYTTRGNITIFTNPNGADGYGTDLENQVFLDKNKKWHTYVFNFFDKPGNTQADFDQVVVGLSRQQTESTLLAIRSLSDKYFFSSEEVERSYDKVIEAQKEWIAQGKDTFWFLDVGAKIDQSCLIGAYPTPDSEDERLVHANIFLIHVFPQGYPISRVVGSYDENQDTDGWHTEKSVKEHLEEYSFAKDVYPTFGCDVTGNQGMIPLFNTVGIDPIDINFSGPKKWAMYQRLKYYFEKNLIHRIKHEAFEYQTKRMIVTKLQAGRYNRVSHEKESDHDDIPDAVAGVIYLLDNPDEVEPSMSMFGFDNRKPKWGQRI